MIEGAVGIAVDIPGNEQILPEPVKDAMQNAIKDGTTEYLRLRAGNGDSMSVSGTHVVKSGSQWITWADTTYP